MRKVIFATILCCSCVLNAGWLGLTKDKTPAELEIERIETERILEIERIETEKKIKICIENTINSLGGSRTILNKYYFLQNIANEKSVLRQYKNIEIKESLIKLTNADSLVEYMQIVLSDIRKSKRDLENNKISLEEFSKKINSLIFAWTVPYEILSTKNVYDHSLSGLASSVYKNIDKKTYVNYEKFIASIIPRNIMLTGFSNGIYSTMEEVESVCTDDNNYDVYTWFRAYFSTRFNEDEASFFVEEKLNIYDESGHVSILFNEIEKNEDLNISNHPINEEKTMVLNDPFNDEWYMMIRKYIKLQDKFYKIKSEINKIANSLSNIDGTEKIVTKIEENLILSDSLYRKLNAIVRYNVIGLPLAIYSDIYTLEIAKAKGLFNDDEEQIAKIALKYNQSCANMQKYVSSEFTRNKFLQIVKIIKKELKEKEYKEIVTNAKLSQDWLNMLNKVKVENK